MYAEFTLAPIDADQADTVASALIRDGYTGAHPEARHVGGFRDGALVGVASMHHEPLAGFGDALALRIGAVAVEHNERGKGLGLLLVEWCLDEAIEESAKVLWCSVPPAAEGFFARLGFESASDGVVFRLVHPPLRPWNP